VSQFRRSQFRFVDTGIAVVLATCLSAICCLALLGWQRSRAIELASQEADYLRYFIQVSNLCGQISNYCGVTISYGLQSKLKWLDNGQVEKRRLHDECAQLRSSIQAQSGASGTVTIRLHLLDRVEATFSRIERLVEGDHGRGGVLKSAQFRDIFRSAPIFFKLLLEVVEDSLEALKIQLAEQERASRAAENSLTLQIGLCILGFAAALAGSIFFLRTFYFGIRRRLEKLAVNALRLADTTPQLEPFASNDEFSRLNLILEKVVVKLRESSEARTFLLCMLAHDMRSPLTAASISLELASGEELRFPAISSAVDEIERVLPFIDDLLQIEKTQSNLAEGQREEILLEDFCDTELGDVAQNAARLGIELQFQFSSQVIEVDAAELAAVLTLVLGYLLATLRKGDEIIVGCEIEKQSFWRIIFNIKRSSENSAENSQCLLYLEEDIDAGPLANLTPRTIKLHPALYHVGNLDARLRYETTNTANSGRLILEHYNFGSRPAGRASVSAERRSQRFVEAGLLTGTRTRPWLASFMCVLALPCLLLTIVFFGVQQQVREAGNLLRDTQLKMHSTLLLNELELLSMRVAGGTFGASLIGSETKKKQALEALHITEKFINDNLVELGKLKGVSELIAEVLRVNAAQAELMMTYSGDGLVDFFARAEQLNAQAKKIGSNVRSSIEQEQKLLADQLVALREYKGSFGVLGSLAMADLVFLLVLVISFRLYFSKRYRQLETRLVDISGLELGRKQELRTAHNDEGDVEKKQGIFSNDELSVLERAVDLAMQRISDNSEYRKAFIAVLRSELVAPVARARQLVEQTLDAKTISDMTRLRLNRARQSLRLVLLLIEDLDCLDSMQNLEPTALTLVRTKFSASTLVDDVCDVLSGMAEGRGVSLVCEYADDNTAHVNISGDRKKLLQALINLVGNAIKFSPSASTVLIRVAAQQHGGSGMLAIAVKDQGPGLAGLEQEKLFEPFYQGDSAQKSKGFGLGLASAQYVVAAHGGVLYVSSTGPRGTTFAMQLPL
jgi:signal transduction histidine kinase